MENDIVGQTVGLKLGSCSSLETPGDEWTDRASGLPSLAGVAVSASGTQTAFLEAFFCWQCSAASKRDSESHETRDGQGPSSPRCHHSLQCARRGIWFSGARVETSTGPLWCLQVSSLYTSRTNPRRAGTFVEKAPTISEPPGFL